MSPDRTIRSFRRRFLAIQCGEDVNYCGYSHPFMELDGAFVIR